MLDVYPGSKARAVAPPPDQTVADEIPIVPFDAPAICPALLMPRASLRVYPANGVRNVGTPSFQTVASSSAPSKDEWPTIWPKLFTPNATGQTEPTVVVEVPPHAVALWAWTQIQQQVLSH